MNPAQVNREGTDAASGGVPRTKVWFWLSLLLLADWALGRGFSWLMESLDLQEEPRLAFQSGFDAALLTFRIHWLPRATILLLLTIFALRQFAMSWRALFGGRARQIALWLCASLPALIVYHGLVGWIKFGQFPACSADALGAPLSFVGIYLFRFLPSAFAEEVVFRGGVFALLNRAYGPYPAIACSVLLFGLGHLYGNWWLLANSMILGVAFTLLYLKTKNLLPGVLAHTISNLIHAVLNY